MAAVVNLYPTELDRVLRAPGGPVGRRINLLARDIAAEAGVLAVARVKKRTGKYARGFKVKVARGGAEGFAFMVYNSATGTKPKRRGSYAAVIEKGSRPHVIRPRARDGYLVFWVNGRKVVTKSVNHPGTSAQHVLRDAAKAVGARV